MKPENFFLGITCVFIALLAGILFHISAARGHDASRPDLDEWFAHLKSQKSLCCDGSDAVHVADPDWDSHDGHFRVRLNGVWVDVPDEAVIKEPNLFGPALVWPYFTDGELRSIRCFIPGTLS